MACRRELARRSITDFATMVDIPTVPVSENDDEDVFETLWQEELAQHHQVLCGALQDVADGVTPNLMVFMPPGSAKSTYVDIVFVPWFMARKPKQNVILACYASDLAKKQGRRARQLVRAKSFQNLFHAPISADNSAADEWSLSNGSEYMAGGILSGITGNRADLLVVDDPIKGREAADSPTIRAKTLAAFEDDLTTRLKPGGRIVIIQTRWHEADLAGCLLPEGWNGESGLFDGRDGRKWRVICIPAEANDNDILGRAKGEMLWPEWFTEEHWRPYRANARTWSALFQQKPSPEGGSMFKRAWFEVVSAAPAKASRVRKWDLAATVSNGKNDPDWTVGTLVAKDENGVFYIEDVIRFRGSALEVEQTIRNTASQDGPQVKIVVPEDPGQAGKSQGQAMVRMLPGFNIAAERETGSKEVRATPFAAQCEAGNVKVIKAAWNGPWFEEHEVFPFGAHDDQVDSAAGGFMKLAEKAPAMEISNDIIARMRAMGRRR